MKEEAQIFHSDVLNQHRNQLFSSLIYEHDVISENLKLIEFNKGLNDECLKRGYFAKKNGTKYWVRESDYESLPLKVRHSTELKHREDIVHEIDEAVTFKVLPEHTMTTKVLVNTVCPFEHSHPDYWTLAKIVAIMGYVDGTYVCLSSKPAFGKSSVFRTVDDLTNKCPVFKPRSIPGCLNKITSTGNMVFDEAHESSKEVRNVMEEITLVLADGSSVYINGALKSANTKNRYDCSNQSITFLYNDIDCYSKPEKSYFEVIWKNNQAMNDRLLKLKLKGIMTQTFDRNFNVMDVAKKNQQTYIKITKELEYLQQLRKDNTYQRRFDNGCKISLTKRKKLVYDSITWLIDQYADNQEEYDKFIDVLNTAITDYQEMITFNGLGNNVNISEEFIED